MSSFSVAKCSYFSVFLRKLEVFSAVRKGSGRTIEKLKNESSCLKRLEKI